MHVLILIFQLAIYRAVCSSPVPPNAIKPRAQLPLLVLLLTFVSLLFALFFTKWLYIIRRRAKGTRVPRTTLRSGWYDNLTTSSSRFGKLFMGSGDVKSGFLIGLLGSPSWETRYSAVTVDRRSPLRDPSVLSRKSASGLSLSQGSKSCSSLHYAPARSLVPEENITLVNTRPMSPPPAMTINRSPLLSDIEYMRLLNGRISATFPSGIPSLLNASPTSQCAKPCPPKTSRSSSASSRGTIQAEYYHFVGQAETNLAANNPPSVTPYPMPKPTKQSSLDTCVFLPPPVKRDTQKPLECFSVALSFPNLVPRFESTLSIININEHSFNSTQSQSARTTPSSLRSRATPPTKHFSYLPSYRRSPKIGPSPLRTMVLPSDPYPDSFQTFSSNRHGYRVRSSPHGTIDTDPAVGLSSTRSSGPKKSTDTDSLLDLMSELAQETSAWDPNVFMDENFKRLIALQHSNPQAALREQAARSRRPSWSSRHRKVQHVFTTLEDIPEVDVTEMMPAPTGDTFIHSFWSDEDDDRQFLISNTR